HTALQAVEPGREFLALVSPDYGLGAVSARVGQRHLAVPLASSFSPSSRDEDQGTIGELGPYLQVGRRAGAHLDLSAAGVGNPNHELPEIVGAEVLVDHRVHMLGAAYRLSPVAPGEGPGRRSLLPGFDRHSIQLVALTWCHGRLPLW